jgi:hypothetical protein
MGKNLCVNDNNQKVEDGPPAHVSMFINVAFSSIYHLLTILQMQTARWYNQKSLAG